MVCPNCQTVNQEGSRFCSNCGTAFSLACTNCGTRLNAGAKFCHNCGQPVARHASHPPEPSASHSPAGGPPAPQAETSTGTPASDRLAQYIPKELIGKLEAARANRSMAGERRIVTILFCDVKGSTSMAEGLDPEEWADIMNEAFKYLIAPVYRYEGTLARLMGDAILAFFGAPIAHEDDAQRAVLAGLDILREVEPFCDRMRREYSLDFNVRVGINTGLVVVGEVGSDLRVEYTAMGDAVNLASRMEQTADPGTVRISSNTYRLISQVFDFEPLGTVELKGKAEAITAYRVLERKQGAIQTRGIEGLYSELVGRDRELGMLRSAVEELQQGRGQIVSIMGEAGLGKSRLVAELRKGVPLVTTPIAAGIGGLGGVMKAPLWLEGRSLSYETNTAFAPFTSMFNLFFELEAGRSDSEKYGQILSRLEGLLGEGASESAPFIATLMGITLEGEASDLVRYLEPLMLKMRILFAVQGLIETLAAKQPVVLVFEDLHWVDTTSRELVEQLAALTERAPVMLMALFRPNPQEPSWQFHEAMMRDYSHRYAQVPVQPLDEAGARRLVGNLLEIEDLPERVRQLILDKAEGNPFFVEEVIRTLLDAGLVVREDGRWRTTQEIDKIQVPDTLQGVITARLDRLDDNSKHVAQTASIIGREFEFDALNEVYEAPATLEPSLTNLQRRELIRERTRIPSRLYLFKHVLTQETAYNSVLLSRRREIHRRVAERLERIDPTLVNDIARHFLDGKDEKRALPYLVQAGTRALNLGSRTEATWYFTRAIEIGEANNEIQLARRAYEGLGKAQVNSGDIGAAMETYGRMLAFAGRTGDAPARVSALNKMSLFIAMMGQTEQAEQQLAEAEQLAREADDSEGLAELFTIKCDICNSQADFTNAERYLSEAVMLGRKIGQKEQEAYGLAHKAQTLTFMAEFEKSYETSLEALRVAEEANDIDHKAGVLGFPLAYYHLRNGDVERARQTAEEGFALSSRIGSLFTPPLAALILGSIAHNQGDYSKAEEWYKTSVQYASPLKGMVPFMVAMPVCGLALLNGEISPELKETIEKFHSEGMALMEMPRGAIGGGLSYGDLGFCALQLGNYDEAEQCFRSGLDMPSVQMHLQRPRLKAGMALVALHRKDAAEAERWIREAQAYAEERGMQDVIPLLDLVAGQVALEKGEHDDALSHFEKAELLAARMSFRPIMLGAQQWQMYVFDKMGRQEEAQHKRQEARSTISEIAALLRNDEHRALYEQAATARLG